MDRKKKSALRAGAVLMVALAAGHLVQTLNAERAATAAETRASIKAGEIEKVAAGPDAVSRASETAPALPETAALTGPDAATSAPAVPAVPSADDTPVLAALPDPPSAGTSPSLPAQPTPPAGADDAAMVSTDDCAANLALTAGPRAMVSVSLTALCRTGERVVLRHAGLAVAERLSDSGTLLLDLPALQVQAEVTVLFPDAEVLVSRIDVPDAAGVRRFAVQWMADDAFQLHAFENGADYGEPGDIWAEAPVSANGGYMVALGNPDLDLPMMSEVYTFPADAQVKTEVTIEATVTETTCGRELLGETLVTGPDGVVKTDLTLAMPDCTALGDILVLKNPGLDVTLATAN